MIISHKLCCPICDSDLKYAKWQRYDDYHCPKQCYSLYENIETLLQQIVFRTKEFVIRVDHEMTIYKNVNNNYNNYTGGQYITVIPIIQFAWDKLDLLENRIKSLIIFT